MNRVRCFKQINKHTNSKLVIIYSCCNVFYKFHHSGWCQTIAPKPMLMVSGFGMGPKSNTKSGVNPSWFHAEVHKIRQSQVQKEGKKSGYRAQQNTRSLSTQARNHTITQTRWYSFDFFPTPNRLMRICTVCDWPLHFKSKKISNYVFSLWRNSIYYVYSTKMVPRFVSFGSPTLTCWEHRWLSQGQTVREVFFYRYCTYIMPDWTFFFFFFDTRFIAED